MSVRTLKILPTDCPHEDDLSLAKMFWEQHHRQDLVANVKSIALEFRAHHESLGSRFLSWPAAWRTWYIRAMRFEKKPQSKDRYKGFAETGRRGRIYVAPTQEEIECVSLQKVREVAEKLRSTAQKRLWT